MFPEFWSAGGDEPFMSDIGTVLPIALRGRNSLYSLRQSFIFDRASSRLVNQWAFKHSVQNLLLELSM